MRSIGTGLAGLQIVLCCATSAHICFGTHGAEPWRLCRLLPEYRDELENHIFADGHKDLRFYLCGQLSRICGVHDLLDMAGEL